MKRISLFIDNARRVWGYLKQFGALKKQFDVLKKQFDALKKQIGNIEYAGIENLFLANKIKKLPNEKIRIVFLYMIPSLWPSWKSLYEACIQDERYDVKLLFLDMNNYVDKTSQHEAAKDFLVNNNIEYINYDEYDIYKNRPHILAYQKPYQGNYKNFPELSIQYIKEAGIRPIYISYGIEYDITINNEYLKNLHFRQPLHKFAWRIFVMHQDIRKDFMKYCRTGCRHVEVFGHPRFDRYKQCIGQLPMEIQSRAKGRKICTYQIHIPNDNDCPKSGRFHTLSFAETCKNIAYLQNRGDIFTIVTIHPLFKTKMIELGFASEAHFETLKQGIAEHENICLYAGDYQLLIANSDAFITENSSLMMEMAYFNKPVLYLYDMPVALRPFAQDIVNTFYHGHNCDDVKIFIDDVVDDKDRYAEDRIEMQKHIFAGYDGKIGERIKDDIAAALVEEGI